MAKCIYCDEFTDREYQEIHNDCYNKLIAARALEEDK